MSGQVCNGMGDYMWVGKPSGM